MTGPAPPARQLLRDRRERPRPAEDRRLARNARQVATLQVLLRDRRHDRTSGSDPAAARLARRVRADLMTSASVWRRGRSVSGTTRLFRFPCVACTRQRRPHRANSRRRLHFPTTAATAHQRRRASGQRAQCRERVGFDVVRELAKRPLHTLDRARRAGPRPRSNRARHTLAAGRARAARGCGYPWRRRVGETGWPRPPRRALQRGPHLGDRPEPPAVPLPAPAPRRRRLDDFRTITRSSNHFSVHDLVRRAPSRLG